MFFFVAKMMKRFSQEKHDESQEQESGHDILTNQCFFRCDAKKHSFWKNIGW